ncbi:unnamed protein product [Spirodela intermedia]|uniref:Uncharacterized protein n=1 Tax=Spirodela intermedia TaxID=51605 RepID=A0A7I8IV11_SPIIN|nr:unnamed protein product [Spirodela intermedia]CAA6661845.1 unnamed protein product [Spirodela intermedia]
MRVTTRWEATARLSMLWRRIAAAVKRGGGGGGVRGFVTENGGGGHRGAAAASSPSLSIWRRKKEMGKEASSSGFGGARLEAFVKSHVCRLLRSDLLAVLAELQRQNLIYEVVRKEIWYRPDMFFYRDMLVMLARNGDAEAAKRVWGDSRKEEVLFDQHTYGDLVRAFCDGGLPDLGMEFYGEMRRSPDPPLSLPFRVILKGLLRHPELRTKVKDDFLVLFPGMVVCDPPEHGGDDDDDDDRRREDLF